ncbi:uncharacterized protein METZ01_LOCUS311193, partial [marine metagenome]
VDRAGNVLINVPLTDGQFVEVNWFSKWSETLPEIQNLVDARKLYVDESFEEYIALCPDLIRGFLSRVKDVDVPKDDAVLLKVLADLGVESEHVVVAEQLLDAASGELDSNQAPSYEKLNALCESIAYYFIPPSLESPLNPMCGMNDVINYDGYFRQIKKDLLQIDETITKIGNSLNQYRIAYYKHSDESAAKKLWNQIDSLKGVVSNLEKSFQTTGLPAIEDQLNKTHAEYDELLKKLDEIENRTLLADVNSSEVSTIEEAQQADVDLRRTGSKLNDLNSEIDELEKTIDTLRKTLKDNPTIAAVVEPQLKAREVERIDAVAKFLEQAAVYLVKLKSLLRFNQSKKQEILSDLKRINSFFEKFEDAIVFI